MSIAAVTLDDKYQQEEGRVFITGMQALVRLPMLQRQRDVAAGLNTAGFISGYRGSPLGGYDAALWQASRFLARSHIKFQPGLNEDLAVTAVWGTQQVNLWPGGKYDGVFGIWYGKGPGVDRSGDAIKHLNYDGTAKHGGVLLIAGDDHGANSSTLPHQSESAFIASGVPVFHPAGVQEYLDLGLHGFAMSRFSGCAVGFKAVGETVESSASVSIDPNGIEIVQSIDFDMPDGGRNLRYPDVVMEKESRLLDYKLPAVQAYVRENRLDKLIFDSPKPRIGIVTTGKAYLDVRQAFDELGLTAQMAADLGIRLYKVALTWPLEPEGALAFAKDLEEILVVEEKRPILEDQLRSLLYGQVGAPKRILGKRDEQKHVLLPEIGELTPGMVARSIVGRLKTFSEMPDFDQRLARIEQIETGAQGSPPTILRTPYFCSGCPHNTSTRVPDGSRSMAGIGCHGMALWMPDRNTQTITHMGAEGVNWIGQAPFCKTDHIFQNLGDGTYYHSGLLAIRAAVDAGVNITYKILFNDAVAMTGGQPVVNQPDRKLTPDEIARQVHAEGVAKVVLVTDEPNKYPIGTNWGPGTTIHHRDDLDVVQKDLRATPGCTILIYDQTCAAEKRRRRKRGLFPDPPKRAFINDLVCEACGDCSVASNCVSVQPKETEWGRKRQIDQSNCNKDFSCVNGFCPSFVTVHGGNVRKAEKPSGAAGDGDDLFAGLPMPDLPSSAEPFGILITGIGGTGVVTISALLGMAAHLMGKGVSALDMAGLAQKNGAVTSHVRISDALEDLHAVRIATGGSKLILGCDIVVASGADVMSSINEGVTGAVVNSHVVPTAQFLADQDMEMAGDNLVTQLRDALGSDHSHFVNATKLATALLGDSIATNIFLLGTAFQHGYLPLSLEAIEGAIEINGVAVEANKRAFAWGRLAAHDPAAVETIASPLMPRRELSVETLTLEQDITRRVSYLTDYQNAAYARRYQSLVDTVRATEQEKAPGLNGLTEAVVQNFFRLMAYKDEYEVARLYTDGRFMEQVNQQFEGEFELHPHLAPPLIARRHPETGHLQKREFGPWVLKLMPLLARMKVLRGGFWDIFGRTAERRMERQLITDYEATLAEVLVNLDHENHAMAVNIAEVPNRIRGFGHVKEKALVQAKKAETEMLELYRAPSQRTTAAE